MELLTDRYKDKIRGMLSCYDRVIITGTLPGLCYAEGMTGYLYQQKVKIFDYPRFAEPFRDQLRAHAQRLADAHGLTICCIRQASVRQEDVVQKLLAERGNHPGLVCILSAMEGCQTYKPWHDKDTHKTFLRNARSQCLHYYFYFIDEDLGLCYLRVPTWCPFRLQFYFNGHNWLANQLKKAGVGYQLLDNAFVAIDDFAKAQQLAGQLDVRRLHGKLDEFAARYCPVHQIFNRAYHWSVMQVEFATDIIFKSRAALASLYEQMFATAIHTVKPERVATFLGRKLDSRYTGEAGSRYSTRIEGRCIKHCMGSTSIKMYDKFGHVLRLETTANDISFFKHYRTVEHRDGSTSHKQAAMKKSIYSLPDLQGILQAANRRYLEFISAIEDRTVGVKRMEQVTQPVCEKDHHYRGFNFFNPDDLQLLLAIARGEFLINGFQSKQLKRLLPNLNTGQISRLLKRLRTHGLIKKIGTTYKYYLTRLGKNVIATALKIKNLVIIPELCWMKTA